MTLFVNSLSALDASYWCAERGLVGASWHVDLELDGELGEDGMLFDFGEVKPWAKQQIDDGPDHTLIVPAKAAGISVTECPEGLCVRTTFPWPMEVRAPRQAFTLLPWQSISRERLSTWLSEQLSKRPPARVTDIRLRLADEAIEGASYTYTHGLKRHAGNCQRIAHGHRSRLYVWRNGQLDEEIAHHWAARLADSYLADRHDQTGPEEDGFLRFAYESAQGRFRIKLPKERVTVLPYATTVEHIADWLAKEIALAHGGRIRVQAFEGINKGAVAEAHGL